MEEVPVAHLIKTMQVTPEEYAVIDAAAAALDMQRSTLIQEGVVEAAHRLGFYVNVNVPIRRRPQAWTDAPKRGEESASMRYCLSFSTTTFDLLQRAAAYAQVSIPIFTIGSALRYIANLKKSRPSVKKLAALKLPAQYE
jgi:uncharacterized protein (DUF1778 family)